MKRIADRVLERMEYSTFCGAGPFERNLDRRLYPQNENVVFWRHLGRGPVRVECIEAALGRIREPLEEAIEFMRELCERNGRPMDVQMQLSVSALEELERRLEEAESVRRVEKRASEATG